jgi:hypothetical protein
MQEQIDSSEGMVPLAPFESLVHPNAKWPTDCFSRNAITGKTPLQRYSANYLYARNSIASMLQCRYKSEGERERERERESKETRSMRNRVGVGSS